MNLNLHTHSPKLAVTCMFHPDLTTCGNYAAHPVTAPVLHCHLCCQGSVSQVQQPFEEGPRWASSGARHHPWPPVMRWDSPWVLPKADGFPARMATPWRIHQWYSHSHSYRMIFTACSSIKLLQPCLYIRCLSNWLRLFLYRCIYSISINRNYRCKVL